MTIETVMYFALGFLIASVLALMILPQVWKRAVRLTTKRIEAATPITLAEFRADKDQLRAEFALSTRRLEMNVETLRRRLASQLNDVTKKKTDLAVAKTEREAHLQIVRELEEREADARRRILELEKDGADTAQRLRMRDREYADKLAQLESMRDAMQNNRPAHFTLNGKALSGIYNTDIEALLAALATERARAEFLDNQSRTLIAQLESSDRQSSSVVATSAELREALASTEDAATQASNELVAAEARIADAENRLNSLLSQTTAIVEPGEKQTGELLADKLKLEDQIERLKGEVLGVEGSVMADWDTDRIDQAHLRDKLNDIASDVSRIVYALDGNAALDSEESLFDRVQKFAGGDTGTTPAMPASAPVAAAPAAPAKAADKSGRVSAPPKSGRSKKSGPVADRLAALRDVQRRH